MSTLAEIEAALEHLPIPEQEALFTFLADRLRRSEFKTKSQRGLKAAAVPALEGLPEGLSVETRERVRKLMKARHAADR